MKSGDTVVRLLGLAKGGGGALYRPQGASLGHRKKILHSNLGMANNFAIGPRGCPHLNNGDTAFSPLGWIRGQG